MYLRGFKTDWNKYKLRATSVQAWKLPKEPSSLAPPGVQSNKDQDPVPLERRTWGAWDFATYWMSDLINSTTWQIASAGMIVGLSTTDAIIIASLSGILNSLPTVLCGGPGTHHHVPFPISIRAAYGYYLSTFCVVSRALLGSVWFGVNTYYGSFIVTEVIAAIWPSYRNIKNHLPLSSNITTQQMVSYILFCMIQFPLLMIPVHRLKTLFLIKAFLLPPLSIAMVIWICVKAGSPGQVFGQPAAVSGSTRAWLWLGTLSANSNAWLSSTINMPDFTRFTKSKRAPLAMIPTIPIVRTVYAILGIAMTGAGRVLYQEDIWNPVLLLSKWTGPGGRFLAFVCGCLWLLAQLSTNVSANSAPFGHDAMSLAPSWINVRRGSVICLMIGSWVMVPWMLVNTAAKFLTFMNGYGCFICAMVSISISDYYLVRRCKLDVPGLYDPHGRYRYKAGANWRAGAVQLFFMAICIPGLANTIEPAIEIPTGFRRIYELNWFINTFGALVGYWAVCAIFPDKHSLVKVTISEVISGVSISEGESGTGVLTESYEAKRDITEP